MQLFIEWGSNLKVLQFLPSAYVQIMIKTKWKDELVLSTFATK